MAKFAITKGLRYWDGLFHNPIEEEHKISLCTSCMGRGEDVKMTLIQNMKDNEDYPNVEFVLLNYGSRDDLNGWVRRSRYLRKQIDKGKLLYLRTKEPKFFNFTHSRNITFRAASGTVVSNVDADNYTKQGFATFLNKCANECPEKMLVRKIHNIHGRVAFFKREFVDILGGYDENMSGYGHEERDLTSRALALDFLFMHFGSDFFKRNFFDRLSGNRTDTSCLEVKNIRTTENYNRRLSIQNISRGILRANQGRHWGKARLTVNFEREVVI